jgi:YbbR domain-containing protein
VGWIRNLLLENWGLKLLSVVLAYALWMTLTQAPAVEIGLSVPLELRNLPVHLQVAGEIPARVHLHLHGPERILRRLEAEDVGVTVDLSRARVGNHRFELRKENVEVPAGIDVVRISPEEVSLELVAR